MQKKNIFRLLCCLFLVTILCACAKPKQQPLPTGNLHLAVAQFTQPTNLTDMLAGYLPENSPVVTENILQSLDTLFAGELARSSQKKFIGAATTKQHYATLANQIDFTNQAALRSWSMVGRSLKADILIVPQVFYWQDRVGSNYGATVPAGVVLDFFVIDTNAETLISRSHFEEIQTPLADNLLNTGKFLRRGGKWLQASELAQEAMEQAIKELGL